METNNPVTENNNVEIMEPGEIVSKPAIVSSNNIEHKDILQHLLSEVHPINLKAEIQLPEAVDMRAKHFQFAVVK